MTCDELFALGKFREAGQNFVAFAKNHGIGLFTIGIPGDQAGLQSRSPTSICDRARPRVTLRRRNVLRLSQGETGRRQIATGGQASTDPLSA